MSRGSKYVALAVAVVCLALVVPVQMKIDSLRAKLVQEAVLPTQLPQSAAVSAALGGFRGIAVDILWMQADSMLNDRQFYQLKTLYELISILQPNFPSVWDFNAWNLAYNISAEWGRPEEKWLWVKEGLDFGSEGLKYNPDSVELWTDLGFMYANKIGKDADLSRRFEAAEGIEPYMKAVTYYDKALAIERERGESNVLLYRLHAQALFHHGKAILTKTGNVPEALRCYGQAADEVNKALEQFPDDNALLTMKADIASAKAMFGQ
jgi:tetratricopeptide (TPR) repeat protein